VKKSETARDEREREREREREGGREREDPLIRSNNTRIPE